MVAGSAGSVAYELIAAPEYLSGAMAWDMYATGELEAGPQEANRTTEEAGETLSDDVWEEMLAQAEARLAIMTPADRQAFAGEVAPGMLNEMGLVEGIRAQLCGFDLLRLFVAVGTAFQRMNGNREGATEPVIADSKGGEPLGRRPHGRRSPPLSRRCPSPARGRAVPADRGPERGAGRPDGRGHADSRGGVEQGRGWTRRLTPCPVPPPPPSIPALSPRQPDIPEMSACAPR